MKFFVYRNLNKRGWVWSIKAVDGPYSGLVVGHAEGILMSDTQFRVSEAGRRRVIRESKKNVHAGVVGEIIDTCGFCSRNGRSTHFSTAGSGWVLSDPDLVDITYNPYKYTSFVQRTTLTPVLTAERVVIWHNNVKALRPR